MSKPSGKFPWLMFYVTDWRADPALRMCSLAARGLWIEMLCLMHEADPYGHLRIKAEQLSAKTLPRAIGFPEDEVLAALAELEKYSVFERASDGTIFSRRMVRDYAKRELDRENGKLGGNPRLKNGLTRRVNPSLKAQKLEPTYQNSESKGQTSDSVGDSPEAATGRGGIGNSLSQPTQEARELSDRIAKIIGHEPHAPGRLTMPPVIQRWLEMGCSPDIIELAVGEVMARPANEDRKPKLQYFEKAIAEWHAKLAHPLPVSTTGHGGGTA